MISLIKIEAKTYEKLFLSGNVKIIFLGGRIRIQTGSAIFIKAFVCIASPYKRTPDLSENLKFYFRIKVSKIDEIFGLKKGKIDASGPIRKNAFFRPLHNDTCHISDNLLGN